jgi:RimJ/RimL family protein N-acetyltransferase
LDKIKGKYGPYVKGYDLEYGKEIKAYTIYYDKKPIGYIQLYNAYDFPRQSPLIGLPQSLAVFDIFIGDAECIGKNIGSRAIKLFIEKHCQNYDAVFVDPDVPNLRAIKSYEKAGFKKIKEENGEIWMIKELG